ncbi:hypothetical protein [Micromonospora sp. NPDC005171]|uniref:hypothetical protein n=1 Tax=Micromonospora sp. NPDC005171 TaxID=3156866 RepID=UPI0033BE7EDB
MSIADLAARQETLVAMIVLVVLFGWGWFTLRRRSAADLAELRSVGADSAPQGLYQLLAWALATDGRTARLVVLLLVVLLLVTLNDALARAVEALFATL